MPRLFVAYRTDGTKKQKRKKMASGSQTTLKKRMREHKGASFAVAFYNFKPSVENICTIIENLADLEAESVTHFRVNDSGQVRETDPPDEE